MFEILKESPLFIGLGVQEVNLLINYTLHQIRQFSSEEVLAFSGEKVESPIICFKT